MEFILTDEKGIEKGPLLERDYIDIDCGEDNTFEIQVTNKYYKKHGITYGWRLGVQGKEYGGVIKRIITNTETDLVTLMGPTWRGMLEKKIIEPPHGQDYRVVSGDANAIINNIVCSEFDGIFICDGESGVSLNNFQFDRYVTQLAGIEKMLLSKNARLDIAYDSGEPNEASFVKLAAAPIKDYSDEIEYSQDGTLGFLSFTFEDFRGGINHLICLGKGELKDRLVLHLYADENGNIGTEQHFFGVEEREATYDYSSAGTEEDLRKNGTEKFKELLSYKSMDMDLFNETLAGLRGINDDISIGDIVGGRDFDTGIYLSKQITRKIVQVKNGRESIEYGVGKPVLNRNSANAPVEQSDPLDKLIKITADGTGLSVGKVAELSNTFDVGLALRIRKAFYQKNGQGFYIENANGVDRECFHINGENQLHIGYGGYQHGDMPTMIDGNQIFLTANHDIVVSKGATFNGQVDAGGKAKMWSDGEGGQFYLLSPNNVEWQMDAYDDNFRIYKVKDGYVYFPLYINSSNDLEVNDLWSYASSKEAHIGFIDNGSYGAFLYSKPKGSDVRIGLYDNFVAGSIWQVLNDGYMYHDVHNVFNSGFTLPYNKYIYFGKDGHIYSSGGQHLFLYASAETKYGIELGVRDGGWALAPVHSGVTWLGSPNYKWDQIYADSSSINTSDRKLKKDITELTDKHIEFFTMLQPVSFKFINGTSGRTHIGFISQDVEEAMNACGLTDLDFAGFCKDQKTERVEKTVEVKKEVPKEMIDETTGETYIGTEIVVEEQTIEEDVPVEGEYIYSLRYEEFIALNTHMIQKQQSEIETLKNEIAKIKSAIGL